MCRWHKHPMKMVATNPQTNEFDIGYYAIAITAMAMYRVEQKQWDLPELFEIDGFNPEEILTKNIQAAYKRSGLEPLSLEESEAKLIENSNKLRAALSKTATAYRLTKDDLNISDIVTKEGYKKTCCAPADPRENGPFLDAAVVYLFKGYDDESRSTAYNALSLISSEELEALAKDVNIPEKDRQYLPRLEAIRSAVQHFLEQDDVPELLEDTFRHSIVYIFQTAQSDFDNGLGLRGESNCIMCEGTKGRKTKPTMD